ncbi:MAG TPA: lytic transglycosylase domain-containing protein [Rhizomicrobium sp.]
MDALTLALSCALAAVPGSACPSHHLTHGLKYASLAPWQADIDDASHRFDIPVAWIEAVIRLESGGYSVLNGKPITSSKGAIGLMQLMPATYADLRRRYGFGPDPYDPRDNISAGTAYLHELYQIYGYPFLFAAYNAGSGRLESYLSGAHPLPHETQTYLAKLHLNVEIPSLDTQKDPLFVVKNAPETAISGAENHAGGDTRLFVSVSGSAFQQ